MIFDDKADLVRELVAAFGEPTLRKELCRVIGEYVDGVHEELTNRGYSPEFAERVVLALCGKK